MASRGQTLVLFTLTLLLLVVMVCMTLGMGSKVKERMELQTLADASAYSSAVATARAFNAVAVLNRVQVAHAVSTLGTLSLISWSTLYWKHADNAASLFRRMAAPYIFNTLFQCLPPGAPKPPIPTTPLPTPPLPQTGSPRPKLPLPRSSCKVCARGLAQTLALAGLSTVHANQTRRKLRRDNELFSAETLPRWNAAGRIHDAQVELLARVRSRAGDGSEGFARQYLSQAGLAAPDEVQVQPAGAEVTGRELSDAVLDHASPRAGHEPHEFAHIAMGSRGHPFLRRRNEGAKWDRLFSSDSLSVRSLTLFAGGHVFYNSSRNGRGYYDSGFTPHPSGRPYSPRAQDGQGGRTQAFFVPFDWRIRNWAACRSPLPAFYIAEVIGLIGRGVGTRNARVSADRHDGIGHDGQHAFRTFPPLVDFNGAQLVDSQNLYGQPKVVTVLSRDPVPGREVWDLSLDFRFSPEGKRTGTPGVTRRQVAVGAGIVYYHRFLHSTEPPNLFAPYWRAGLARFSIDRPELGQPERFTFDARTEAFLSDTGATGARDALQSLRVNGYTGW